MWMFTFENDWKKIYLLQRRYYKFNKPYGYLSQFTNEGKWKGLSQILNLPEDVYSVGRLDAESEGLLLLTIWLAGPLFSPLASVLQGFNLFNNRLDKKSHKL